MRVLLNFAPGKGYPRHKHPAGEEVFVVSGVYLDNGVDYPEGSYIYGKAENTRDFNREMNRLRLIVSLVNDLLTIKGG